MDVGWKSTEGTPLLPDSEVRGDGGLDSLLSASAVRQRCHEIGEIAAAGNANWFSINEARFKRCTVLVAETCRKNYPDLNIPLHSRWRHFEIKGIDLWTHYTGKFTGSKMDLARCAVDLVFISVILDAGAGSQWRYHDPVSGETLSRSEGLAAASVDLFFNHLTRFDHKRGWWVEADTLGQLSKRKLAEVFQVSADNPLVGLDGRLELIHRLAEVLEQSPAGVAGKARPGDFIDHCLAASTRSMLLKRQVNGEDIVDFLLRKYGDIWPNGFVYEGNNLGDCGYHSALDTGDQLAGIVPFHKLTQWLAYSLVEPLQMAGIQVSNLDGLTGLPEYRNGGLLIDTGVLQPLDMGLFDSTYTLDAETVVEWRALTVYALDRIAVELRKVLKLNARRLPLCAVLQGGTWAAGRELAYRLREDGAPPLKLNIDGTIF